MRVYLTCIQGQLLIKGTFSDSLECHLHTCLIVLSTLFKDWCVLSIVNVILPKTPQPSINLISLCHFVIYRHCTQCELKHECGWSIRLLNNSLKIFSFNTKSIFDISILNNKRHAFFSAFLNILFIYYYYYYYYYFFIFLFSDRVQHPYRVMFKKRKQLNSPQLW